MAHAQTSSEKAKTEISDVVQEKTVVFDEVISEANKRYTKKTKKPKTPKLRDRSATLAMGEKYLSQGDYEKAQKYYGKILNYYDRDPYVNYRMGLTVYRMESYAEARPYFEAALRNDPNIYEAYSTLSASYILEGNIEGAEIVYKRLKDWRKHCGLMCFADNGAFKAEYEIEGMLKWAKQKNANN